MEPPTDASQAVMEPQATKPDPVQIEPGVWADPESGEIVGVDMPETLLTDGQARMTLSLMDWVLGKIQDAQSKTAYATDAAQEAAMICADIENRALEAVRATPEYRAARATIENCEAMLKQAERKEQFFLGRYGEQLRELANDLLGTGKSRTVTRPHGRISLRKAPDKIQVVDESASIADAKAQGWTDAISESFRITGIPEPVRKAILSGERPPLAGTEVVHGEDKMEVKCL